MFGKTARTAVSSFTIRHKATGVASCCHQFANGDVAVYDSSSTMIVSGDVFVSTFAARVRAAFAAEFEAANPSPSVAHIIDPASRAHAAAHPLSGGNTYAAEYRHHVIAAPAKPARKPRAAKPAPRVGVQLKDIKPRNGAKLPTWSAVQAAFYRAETDLQRLHVARQGADLYRATWTPSTPGRSQFRIGVKPGKAFEAIEAVLAQSTCDVIEARIVSVEGADSEMHTAWAEFLGFQTDAAMYGPDAVAKTWDRFVKWLALDAHTAGEEGNTDPTEFYAPPSHALALAFL